MTTTEPQTGSRLLDLVGTMESEAEPLAKRPQAPLQKPPVTPGHEWDGTTGYIQTRWTPGSTEPDDSVWDDLIRELGMDPAKVMVAGTPRISSWDAQTKDGVERLFSYRAQLAPRGRSAADIDALVVAAKRGAFVPKAVDTDRAYVVALGDLQLGKALADDTPVLTPSGWVNHGDLRPGMQVYGQHGKPVNITAVTGSTDQRLYDVVLRDGSRIRATGDHRWTGTRRMHPAGYRSGGPVWEDREMTITTDEIAEMIKQSCYAVRPFQVLASDPIEMPEADLPIDPYTLGLWLGDGNRRTGIITTNAADREQVAHLGHMVSSCTHDNVYGFRVPGLTRALKDAGLQSNKHVPEAYLSGSVDQRLALVQGLMDTDGTCSADGGCSFTNTNEQVVDALEHILHTLGIRSKRSSRPGILNGVEHQTAHTLYFRTEMDMFRFERKLSRQRVSTERQGMYRSVVSVEPAGRGSAQCITVDGGLYLAGRDLVVTHNCDSDGLVGTVDRFFRALADSVERYVRQFRGLPVYVLYLGDCIEGFVSQGGANAWRTTATLTEQVRTYQRLVLEQVKAFADVAPRVVVAGVPGNHDEATRPLQKYADSWAVQSLVAVHDALKLAGEAGQKFDHVEILVPGADELTLTLDICGTRVALAHGHQFGRGARGHITWWDGQMRGRQDPGTADVLLAGHRHHLHIETIGTAPGENARHFIQVPALEGESTWWRHRAGEGGEPGILTFSVGGGSWSDLQVHSYPVQPRG